MTAKLKLQISQRQKAYHHGNRVLFRYFDKRLNRERKLCKSLYYQTKVQELVHQDPKKSWPECRRICGMQNSFTDLTTKLLEGKSPIASNIKRLAKEINQAFLEPQQVFSSLADDYHLSAAGYQAPTLSL